MTLSFAFRLFLGFHPPKRQNVMNKICNKRKAVEICKFVYNVASSLLLLSKPPSTNAFPLAHTAALSHGCEKDGHKATPPARRPFYTVSCAQEREGKCQRECAFSVSKSGRASECACVCMTEWVSWAFFTGLWWVFFSSHRDRLVGGVSGLCSCVCV